MPVRRHLLFVCSRNQWRSPTGEAVFRDDPRFAVRSRGTSPRADDLLGAGRFRLTRGAPPTTAPQGKKWGKREAARA